MNDKHRPLFIREDGSVELKDEPKAAECGGSNICDEHGSFFGPPPNSPCPVCNKPTGRLQPASSSEFDEALRDYLENNIAPHCEYNAREQMLFTAVAKWAHAKDAEEIADWIARDKYSQKVRTDQAEQIAELTEENQRLKSELTTVREQYAEDEKVYSFHNKENNRLSDKNKELRERIEKLEKEIIRLNRVILKELTENDELGCEYTYVNALRESNRKLTAALKSLRHAIVGHKGNGEVIPMIDEALAADSGGD